MTLPILEKHIAVLLGSTTLLGGTGAPPEQIAETTPKQQVQPDGGRPEQLLHALDAGYQIDVPNLKAFARRGGVSRSEASEGVAAMKAITERAFAQWAHYRPEDMWLKDAQIDVVVERLGQKSLGSRPAAENAAKHLDREIRRDEGRPTKGLWPIDERPDTAYGKYLGAKSFAEDVRAGYRPELYRVKVTATSADKQKSYDGVVFAMPGPTGPRIMDLDLMQRLYPVQYEMSDVVIPGQGRLLSQAQLGEIDQRSSEWFHTNRDARYDEGTKTFTETVHAGGYDAREQRGPNLEATLQLKACAKVSQFGLRDHGNEWVTKDQIELLTFTQGEAGRTVTFRVRAKDGEATRATGQIDFGIDGPAGHEVIHWRKVEVKNGDLERKSMGDPGVDTVTQMFGEWLEKATRQSMWNEMKARGLVLPE